MLIVYIRRDDTLIMYDRSMDAKYREITEPQKLHLMNCTHKVASPSRHFFLFVESIFCYYGKYKMVSFVIIKALYCTAVHCNHGNSIKRNENNAQSTSSLMGH